MATQYAKTHNSLYYATSAKTGNGVTDLFTELARSKSISLTFGEINLFLGIIHN